MKKYRLTAQVTISIYTDVEAETEDKAKEIAEERSVEGHEWGNEDKINYVWIANDYDGEPYEIRIEEL